MHEDLVRITHTISVDELAENIADQDYEDVVNLILSIDSYIGDSEFTDLLKREVKML